MKSKRFSVANGDLTSGEVVLDITISEVLTSSNAERTRIFYPASFTCFNATGDTILLTFLTSGELALYQADPTNYDGIVVGYEAGNAQAFGLTELPKSDHVVVKSDGSISTEFEISFYRYVSKG